MTDDQVARDQIFERAIEAALAAEAETVAPPRDGPATILRMAAVDLMAAGDSPPRRRAVPTWVAAAAAAALTAAVAVPLSLRHADSSSEFGAGRTTQDAAPADGAGDDAAVADRSTTGTGGLLSSTTAAAGGASGDGLAAPMTTVSSSSTRAARTVTLSVVATKSALDGDLKLESEFSSANSLRLSDTDTQIVVPVDQVDRLIERVRNTGTVIRTTVTETDLSARYASLRLQAFSYRTAVDALTASRDRRDSCASCALTEARQANVSDIRARLALVERRLAELEDRMRYAVIRIHVVTAHPQEP